MSHKIAIASLAIAAVSIVLFLALSRGDGAQTLTISAAASLREACLDIQEIYQSKHPNVQLLFNFAGSGTLANQILLGAPVDVFLSASQDHIERLENADAIDDKTTVLLAANTLLLTQPMGAPFKLNSFERLLGGKVDTVAIGNPQTVPAGRYAQETLVSQGLMDRIAGKIVFAEHVRQVLDYVARSEVDAGIVYKTDFELVKDRLRFVAAAPLGSHSDIVYVGAVVSGTQKRKEALEFLNVLTSKLGRESLERRGFRAMEK